MTRTSKRPADRLTDALVEDILAVSEADLLAEARADADQGAAKARAASLLWRGKHFCAADSTLVNQWLGRMASEDYRCAELVFGWVFLQARHYREIFVCG